MRTLLGLFLLLITGIPGHADFIATGSFEYTDPTGKTPITSSVARINEITGEIQLIGGLFPNTIVNNANLTRDPVTGAFYFVGASSVAGATGSQYFYNLFTFDLSNTQPRVAVPLSTQIQVQALAASPVNGLLYAVTANDDSLYTIDPRTGQVALVARMGSAFRLLSALAFGPNDTLFGYTYNSRGFLPSPGLFRVDTQTGATTVLTPPGSGVFEIVSGMSFTTAGDLWAINSSSYFQLDPTTGLSGGTFRNLPGSFLGMAFLPDNTVPEPNVVALVSFGIICLFVTGRYGFKAKA